MRPLAALLALSACTDGHTGMSSPRSKSPADSGGPTTASDAADTPPADAGGSSPTVGGARDAGHPAHPKPDRPTAPVALELKNYMFVTSSLHAADFGGQSAADAICNNSARTASLAGTYVAWLSTAQTDAKSRIPAAVGGWVRPDERPFAVSRDALLAGQVLYPPRLDELGNDLARDHSALITATQPDGTYYGSGNYTDCEGWTSSDTTIIYRTGSLSGGTYQWTAADGATCTQLGRILCLGVDDAISVKITPSLGRLAFLSRGTLVPGAGVSGADALCAREARAAARSSTFIALLASNGASATSRLSAGEPWVRADGVAIVDQAADLLAGRTPLAPISLQLDGEYRGTVGVWTGADAPDSVPTSASHCSD
ncbi:MAG TPA: hypothetical protein VF331_22370, partial [Polyangiales bacterium]